MSGRSVADSGNGRMARGALVLALTLFVACAKTGSDDPSPTPTPGGLTWIDTQVLGHESGGIVIERVSYRSQGLKIWGEICRPEDAKAHPVLLWNHGGFEGLGDGDRVACRSIARSGYVAVSSYYRGEGGSEGSVEVCKGEVDDVAAMLAIVKQQPYADPTRVAALGGSHGGCITMRLALRTPELRAAVDFFGPTDWAALHDWVAGQIAQGEPLCKQLGRTDCVAGHQRLLDDLRRALGGTPLQAPQAYAERSPLQQMGQLTIPTLLIHGTDDVIVPLEQSCAKRAALTAAGRTVGSWNLTSGLRERSSSTVCGGGFRSTSVLLAVAENYAFVVYEGQGHELNDTVTTHAIALSLAFVLPRL